jgi:hypothetical protein
VKAASTQDRAVQGVVNDGAALRPPARHAGAAQAVQATQDDAVRGRFLAVSRRYLFETVLVCDERQRVRMASKATHSQQAD